MKKVNRPKSSSSLLGCLGAFILVSLCIVAFMNLVEVVKYAGAPFLVIPNALGLVDTVGRNEVIKVSGDNRSTMEIEIPHPGKYLIHLPTWEQLDQMTAVSIVGEVDRVSVSMLDRGTRPYDTTAANGFPEYLFTIDQAGIYEVSLTNRGEIQDRELEIAIVPDHISGNEAMFNGVMGFQLLLILFVIGLIIFIRRQRKQAAIEPASNRQQKKRADMDDFIGELKDGS